MRLFLYLLLPVLVFCCEDSWAEFNGYCYKRFSDTYAQAGKGNYICRLHGGYLASITSDAERDFIQSMTATGKSAPMKLQTIIGAYRNTSYGPWIWYDGTPFNENHRFASGGPQSDKLCLYLLSDNLVDEDKRESERYSDYYFAGINGIFVAGNCWNSHRKFVCKKKDTTNRRTEKMCGSTWTTLGPNCYKRFSVPSINVKESENYCRTQGGHLVSVTTEEEKKLVIEMTKLNEYKYWDSQTVIGCYRESNRHPWKWYDGTPFNQTDWFYLDMISNENCCQLFPDECAIPGKKKILMDMYYHSITGRFCTARCSFKAHEFVCEKKGCDLSVSTFSEGRCVCNKGFVDITETSLLEAKNYAKGERCIPKLCHFKKQTSLLFIIDSSESITTKHWPKMLSFLESAATKLPTEFRVGFVKFSTKVSTGKWLKRGWTASDFKKAIPFKYEGGDTNTPAALKRAKELFLKDKSKEKIAVLITDGLPVSDEYDSAEAAQNATVDAAKDLHKDDIRLIVMGVGPQIFTGEKKVKEWVQNPERDYYSNREHVGMLKEIDMDKLVKQVCN